ncbi:hypothetical protein FRC11_001909 [Ceratobasidium sp. 423]|nr:hypothetical protein FRC11_001909 [Ceratobasidium sp. 423]
MAESRKAAAESATKKEEREAKREEREIKAATEEETYRKRQLDIEEEKRSDLQRYNEHLRDRRRKDAIGMLSRENKYVRDEGERILKAIAKEEEQAVNKTKP